MTLSHKRTIEEAIDLSRYLMDSFSARVKDACSLTNDVGVRRALSVRCLFVYRAFQGFLCSRAIRNLNISG